MNHTETRAREESPRGVQVTDSTGRGPVPGHCHLRPAACGASRLRLTEFKHELYTEMAHHYKYLIPGPREMDDFGG